MLAAGASTSLAATLRPLWAAMCAQFRVCPDSPLADVEAVRRLVPHALGDPPHSSWWLFLCGAYEAPGRAYHTLAHLAELHGHADEQHAASPFADRAALSAAIFFHDVVYEVPARAPGANENLSAELFRLYAAQAALDAARTQRICQAIAATFTHQLPEGYARADADAAGDWLPRFLDMDLAILGAPAPRYAEYAAAIRFEYSVMPELAFCSGRAKFLRGAIEKDVFLTRAFRETHEAAARRNMAAEIAQLEARQAQLLLLSQGDQAHQPLDQSPEPAQSPESESTPRRAAASPTSVHLGPASEGQA